MINLNATLLIQLLNFLLLMFLLNRILFRPMLKVLEERRARTEGRRKQAAQLDSDAQAIWDDYQKRVHAAKAAADRDRAQTVREGEGERDKILQTSAAEADKAVAEVRARVRKEADQARQVLRAEADRLAASVAQRILGRAV